MPGSGETKELNSTNNSMKRSEVRTLTSQGNLEDYSPKLRALGNLPPSLVQNGIINPYDQIVVIEQDIENEYDEEEEDDTELNDSFKKLLLANNRRQETHQNEESKSDISDYDMATKMNR